MNHSCNNKSRGSFCWKKNKTQQSSSKHFTHQATKAKKASDQNAAQQKTPYSMETQCLAYFAASHKKK